MALLEVEDLSITLPTARGPARAVRNASFTLEAGEALGLVGESGSGKSLTALALLGLLPEQAIVEGHIRLRGQDLLGLSETEMCRLRGNRIAMIFQEPMTALNPLHTIGRQIAEPLRLHRGLGRAAAAEVRRLLGRVGLNPAAERAKAYPHQLSGGQRQRAMIAMALACAPDLLIADEPTTALDVTVAHQILNLMAEVAAEHGMALLLISHDLGIIAETTQRMLVMYGGQVVESGPTASVFASLAHPYTRGLFAARPSVQEKTDRLPTIPGSVPDLADLPPGCPFADRCALALPACAEPPPPVAIGPGHSARCIRLDALPPVRGTASARA